jgi:HAE1 family hydrophobic/amphiphilic exporter-1
MLAATILTLAFVPVFYAVIEQLRQGSFLDEPAAAHEALEGRAVPAE